MITAYKGGIMGKEVASKDKIKDLIDGTLPWNEVKDIIRLKPKDDDRFEKVIEILQEKVSWDDRILLRISDKLFIVAKGKGERVVKCECGHELGDYRVNWKYNARIRVRKTKEEMAEVVTVEDGIPNTDFMEMREFYCPGCYVQLGVEVVPHGYPPVFEILPDLDTLYRDWLDKPLDDESPDWFEDRTTKLTEEWGKE
jgi:acetone carboxylase gamma subunit